MRISMAPLMLWVDRSGNASGAKGSPDSHRVRSSSASRFTAAQAGFFVLSQLSERPER